MVHAIFFDHHVETQVSAMVILILKILAWWLWAAWGVAILVHEFAHEAEID